MANKHVGGNGRRDWSRHPGKASYRPVGTTETPRAGSEHLLLELLCVLLTGMQTPGRFGKRFGNFL